MEIPVPKSPLRFVVGDDPGRRSGTWRVFAQGDEVYVARRGADVQKASLHSGGSRFQHYAPSFVWGPPPEFAPGATLLYRVYCPSEEHRVPVKEPAEKDKAKTVLVPPPPPGQAAVVSVARTSPGIGLNPPHGPNALLARWPLRSGDQLWVVAEYVGFDDEALVKARAERDAYLARDHPTLGHGMTDDRVTLYSRAGHTYNAIDMAAEMTGSEQ